MNTTRTCPHCGRANSNANAFCSTCGGKIKTTGVGLALKLLLGVLALVVGVVWTMSLTQLRRDAPLPQSPQTPQYLTTASASAPAQANSLELSSAQHLAEAKRALADNYKPNKDPKKATWGEVAAARWHLKAIGSSAPEYREAQELVKEVARRERQIELAAKAEVTEAAQARESASAGGVEGGEAEGEDSSSAASPPQATSAPLIASPPTRSAVVSRAPTTPSTGGATSGDYYKNVDGQEVRRPTFSSSVPAGATAQCRDGSYSFSQNRRGTCSHHGGVAKWL